MLSEKFKNYLGQNKSDSLKLFVKIIIQLRNHRLSLVAQFREERFILDPNANSHSNDNGNSLLNT